MDGIDRERGKELHDLFREVFLLRDVLEQVMEQTHVQAGLSTPKARILRTLAEEGPATVPDLARALNVSRQFVLKICNELCKDQYIEFMDNPRHKTSKLASCTQQGIAARNAFRAQENSLIARALPHADRDEIRAATRLLHILTTQIRNRTPAGD